jgi:protein-tyrosine phosphatase
MKKQQHIIACEQVRNLRDFGGWETSSGGQVVWGKLFRSGHWFDAKTEAHTLLGQLNPQVFIDLRRPAERAFQPNQLPDAPAITQLVSGGADSSDPPHLKFLKQGDLSQDSVRTYMQSAYRRIPLEPQHTTLFRQTILRLGNGSACLIHCAAGKDRTGILAALILLLLEVPMELVLEDYLLTNKAVDIAGLMPGIARQIEERLQVEIPEGALFPMLGVESGFLETALAEMGDIHTYARRELRLDDQDIERLQSRLLG